MAENQKPAPMEPEDPDHKSWRTILVAAEAFRRRIDEVTPETTSSNPRHLGSVYSRLALLHQVAKSFAVEAVQSERFPNPIIDIDELTDPPLSDNDDSDGPVLITFGYS